MYFSSARAWGGAWERGLAGYSLVPRPARKVELLSGDGAGTSDGGRPSGTAGSSGAAKGLRGTAVRAVLWEYPAREGRELVPRLR